MAPSSALDALAAASPALLALGLVLRVAANAARGLSWHGVLAAAHTRTDGLTRRRAVAAHLAGAGVSGLLPKAGGDLVRVAALRARVRGTSVPALGGALAVEGLVEALYGLAVGAWLVRQGAVHHGGDPGTWVVVAVGVSAVLALVGARVAPGWTGRQLTEAKRGLAVLRAPGAYARTVLPWQLLARALRFGSILVLLAAFGLPATFAAVAAVGAARAAGRVVPVPGARTAAGTAALVALLPALTGRAVDAAAATAYGVAVPAACATVGTAVSLGCLWALGLTPLKSAWRRLKAAGARRTRPRPALAG